MFTAHHYSEPLFAFGLGSRRQPRRQGSRAVLFPTFTFAAFFAVVLPVSWLLRGRPVPWKLFVLGASYWFYGAWDRRFVLLLAAMTLVNAAAARLNSRSERSGVRKAAVFVGVGFDLVVLGFFKYYGFFTQSLEANLGISSPALSIVLPVGISFYTFQAISYVVDVHRRKTRAVNLLDFAVYLSFFPQLVAGPIVRASEFIPQMRFRPRRWRDAAGCGDDGDPAEQLGLWADRDMAFPTGVGHQGGARPGGAPDRAGDVQEGGDRRFPGCGHRG